MYPTWDSMKYSQAEFQMLYDQTNGFTDDLHSNSSIRPANMSFDEFIDAGSDLLIKENFEILSLLQ